MRKYMMAALAVTLFSGTAFPKVGPMRFRAEVKPIGGITSSDIDGLGVRYDNGLFPYSETLDGYTSYMGTAQIGLEFDTKPCYFDLLLGGGFSANTAFAGGLFTGDIGCRFKINNEGTFAIGPFIGFIAPTDAEWQILNEGDEGTIDMKRNSGLQGGLKLTGGWENFSMVLQLGYAQYSYDFFTEDPAAWEIRHNNGAWIPYATADKKVEMDGFFGQFGMTAQF